MLYSMDYENKIKKLPHLETQALINSRLSVEEIDNIKNTLNETFDSGEIHTAGWIPGKTWEDTPYQIIYEKAAKQNYEIARRMFGLLVMTVFMERDDEWIFGNFEKNGISIGSKTYFKKPK